MVELLFNNKNASTQSGSKTIFDNDRPAPSTRVFLDKSSTIKWIPRRVLEFPWISEVPSNPQLTLAANLGQFVVAMYTVRHSNFDIWFL